MNNPIPCYLCGEDASADALVQGSDGYLAQESVFCTRCGAYRISQAAKVELDRDGDVRVRAHLVDVVRSQEKNDEVATIESSTLRWARTKAATEPL